MATTAIISNYKIKKAKTDCFGFLIYNVNLIN